MLTHLQIRDFAIIDLIELEVRAGLTVLTGETGAGKSIVVDALALLAGGKGGAEVVRAGAERAELSATFDISESPAELRELLAEQSVDAEDELTVRRVIANDGRSRGYLNGVSVPLNLLRDVGAMVVDIHGQHEFQSLTRNSAQRELLDDFGKNLELAGSVREAHKIWIALVNRTVELEGKAQGSRLAHRAAAPPGRRAQGADPCRRAKWRASPRSAPDIRIAAGSPRPPRRRLACCTTLTKAMRMRRLHAHWPASRRCPVSIRVSQRSSPWSTRPLSRSARRRASCRATSRPWTSTRRARKKSSVAWRRSKS